VTDQTPRPLRLAIPNKGRLEEPSVALLAAAGLSYEKTIRSLSVPVRNVAMELLFVRTEDIPELVSDGVAELGITGIDLLAESGAGLEELVELGYGRCRLAAAVPAASEIEDIAGFAGLRVATSHPTVTRAFFAAKGIEITLVPLRGSVEVAPKLDVADAVVDLVSSGSTMLVNGLRPVLTILESQAVLVAGPTARNGHSAMVDQVATMFRAVIAGRRKRYLLMNAPRGAIDPIEAIIPGLDAPSVVPLAHDDMVAIHSVVDADDVWRILPELKAAGASGILVLPVEQLIP
jgi:ATP phosphoribosyltransferase